MDKMRTNLEKLIKNKGSNLREASLAIGRNESYLHQFVKYEKPKVLPELDRLKLAKWLEVEEIELRQTGHSTAPRGRGLVPAPDDIPQQAYDRIVDALEAAIRERGVSLGSAEKSALIGRFLEKLRQA